MKTVAEWVELYSSDDFLQNNFYTGPDLGVHCHPSLTTAKIWSPSASNVLINFYKDDHPSTRRYWSAPMSLEPHGVWSWSIPESLHGTYYDFSITIDDETYTTIDPYAKSAGANGQRGVVIDLRKTNPENWHLDKAPAKTNETIICETHIKEFSWHPSGGWSDDNRGKFLALAEPDTKLTTDNSAPTGLKWVSEMGYTHIQLMPIFDFATIDELHGGHQFNWGYDPLNFNTPEGSYSSNPSDGVARIKELKQAIQACHSNGLRVVMDVVYNHTYNLDNALQHTAPYYYYRTTPEGYLSNGSGCGNDIASERPMAEKLIIDSVLYWAKEYHIDGFRFDLMGLLTIDLINKIQRELDKRYGAGEKLIYGEPWAAAKTFPMTDAKLATKENLHLLDSNVGIFCDDTRDAIKGSASDLSQPGFVNGANNLEHKILNGIKAWQQTGSSSPQNPGQVINYVAAHDNQTLWDKLTETTPHEEDRYRQYKLATAILMMSQGRPFILAGSSFARTKGGHDNSYNAPIEINQLDWSEITKQRELVNYHRGLLHLRQQLPGLYDKDRLADTRIDNTWIQPGVVGFMVDNTTNKNQDPSPWEYLCVVFNRNNQPVDVELASGDWEILANSSDSWLWRNPTSISSSYTVPAIDWVLMGQKYGTEVDG